MLFSGADEFKLNCYGKTYGKNQTIVMKQKQATK